MSCGSSGTNEKMYIIYTRAACGGDCDRAGPHVDERAYVWALRDERNASNPESYGFAGPCAEAGTADDDMAESSGETGPAVTSGRTPIEAARGCVRGPAAFVQWRVGAQRRPNEPVDPSAGDSAGAKCVLARVGHIEESVLVVVAVVYLLQRGARRR